MLSKNIIEGGKEILRMSLISVLPVLISAIELGKVDYRVILITFVIAVLKGIDKYLHLEEVVTPLDLKFIK
jgi:hypothetical protein